MPNYFTHLMFGAKVLRLLPLPWAERCYAQREAFNLGCLGPDPLFFYHPALPNSQRREGLRMHKKSAAPAFERLREGICAGVPQSESYAAGFLCHFALDAACHGLINERATRGMAHLAIEAELDRRLIQRRGLNAQGVYMPPIEDAAAYTAAAMAYDTAGPAEIEKGYLAMRRDSLFFAKCHGTRVGGALNTLIQRIPPLKKLEGVILGAEPAPGSEECSRGILNLLEEEVPRVAQRIVEFMNLVEKGQPLSLWFHRDFYGNTEEQKT